MNSHSLNTVADLDSKLANVSEPVDRADILCEMSELLLDTNPDRSIALCREAVALVRSEMSNGSSNQSQYEQAFKQVNSLLRNVPNTILYQTGGGIEFVSSNVEEVLGYTAEEITNDRNFFPKIIHTEDFEQTDKAHRDWINAGANGFGEIEFRVHCKDGSIIWLLDRMRLGFQRSDGRRSYIGAMIDITKKKNIEAEREDLISELKEAISKIKTLSGLIPICSNCKNIRDDKGFWNKIEIYISKHSDTTFTHGICPDCKDKLYPELTRKKLQ